MRNFISQIGSAIDSFFSSLYRPFIQPQAVPELFLGERSPIEFEVPPLVSFSPLVIPILPTTNINPIIEHEHLFRMPPTPPLNDELWQRSPILDSIRFRPENTQWNARWFRHENTS